MNRLEQIVVSHNGAAVNLYCELGAHDLTLWAESESERAVAIPLYPAAVQQVTAQDLSGMLGVLAATLDADVFGRSDEAWSKVVDDLDASFKPGDLARMSDYDPTVRTVLISHGIDASDGSQVVCWATASVPDQGDPVWSQTVTYQVEGAQSVQLRAALEVVRRVRAEGTATTITALARTFADLGWHLQRSPATRVDW